MSQRKHCGFVVILGAAAAFCMGQTSPVSRAPSRAKPRVFIEWRDTGVFVAPRTEDQVEAFTQACPYIVVTQKETDADAILRMNHQHGSGGVDLYRWVIVVGDKRINDAGRKVAIARDHSCRGILSLWRGENFGEVY